MNYTIAELITTGYVRRWCVLRDDGVIVTARPCFEEAVRDLGILLT